MDIKSIGIKFASFCFAMAITIVGVTYVNKQETVEMAKLGYLKVDTKWTQIKDSE